jgi:hypothetical protein
VKARVEVDGRVIELDDGVLARHGTPADAAPVRQAHAAAHVMMLDSYADVDHAPDRPGAPDELAAHVDWEATMELRKRLDALGLGVAEAMDTAQRFELGWTCARRLIEGTGALGLARPFIAGASTDHLPAVRSKQDLVEGVSEQVRFVREQGGEPILLPMPWLCASGAGEDEYVEVYGEIVRRADGPLWIHWLGEAFLPALAGYFPGRSFERVMALDREQVPGVKLSLLDAEREVAIRRALAPHGQLVLTGDDLHFADLIAGDEHGHSHALLGILDAVARPAALALRFLASGDRAGYDALMRPCEALGRHVFAAPTPLYKAGLAFLSWLDGRQANPMLPNHLQRARDRAHFLRCAELASAAGVLEGVRGAADRLLAFAAGRLGAWFG